MTRIWTKTPSAIQTWLLIRTHSERVPLTKCCDNGGQHKYRLVILFTSLNRNSRIRKKCGRFLLGLAGEKTNNVTRGLQNVGQSFTNQLAGLLTTISAQGVS